MIDLGQLEAFIQVAERSSFSRAADVLYLTQPTISARIHTLEREVGELLFERSSRSVRLTEAGQTFMPYARRTLEMYREGRLALDSLRQATGGKLRIGAARVYGTYLLPNLLDSFARARPGVTVSVMTARGNRLVEALKTGEIDVGFTRHIESDDLVTVDLGQDPIMMAVHPDSPLATAAEIPARSLVRQPLILFDPDSVYYHTVLGLCRDAGVTPDIIMELDGIEAAKRMVARGLGISVLPYCSMREEIDRGVLTAVPLAGQTRSLDVCLLFRKRVQSSYLVNAFIENAQEQYLAGTIGTGVQRQDPDSFAIGSIVD